MSPSRAGRASSTNSYFFAGRISGGGGSLPRLITSRRRILILIVFLASDRSLGFDYGSIGKNVRLPHMGGRDRDVNHSACPAERLAYKEANYSRPCSGADNVSRLKRARTEA